MCEEREGERDFKSNQMSVKLGVCVYGGGSLYLLFLCKLKIMSTQEPPRSLLSSPPPSQQGKTEAGQLAANLPGDQAACAGGDKCLRDSIC